MALANNTLKYIFRSAVLVLTAIIPAGCWVYSFSGISMSPDIKTVQIDYFQNDAPLVNPTLSSYFTTQLQDIFMARTSLQQVKSNGDLVFEGEIVTYDQTSEAPTIDPITGRAVAGKVRLTIGVKVRFYNTKDEEQNFDRVFRNYADIEGTETLSGTQEQTLVEQIVTLLVEDILTSSVAQW